MHSSSSKSGTALFTAALILLSGQALADEPDGAIPRANTAIQAIDGTAEIISAEIGDGDFGASSGDYDWYMVPARSGDEIFIDPISASVVLDILVYDKQGNRLARNLKSLGPGGEPVAAVSLRYRAPVGDAYYVLISDLATGPPDDPFDPGSGNGAQATGPYEIGLSVESTADSVDDLAFEQFTEPTAPSLGATRNAATLVGEFPGPGAGLTGAAFLVEMQAGEVLVADMWAARSETVNGPRLLLRDDSDTVVAEADDSAGLWGSFDPSMPRTHDPFLVFEAAAAGDFGLDPTAMVETTTRSGNYQVAASVVEPGIEIVGSLTGAWFNPADDGQGLAIEVVSRAGGGRTMALAWFTTDLLGNGFWVQGAAPIDPGKGYVIVPIFAARVGSPFGPQFQSMDLTREAWGYLVVTFQDCDTGTVYYGSNFGFGTAEYPIQRITSIDGLACID